MPLYSWKYSRVQNVVTFRFVQNIHVYLAGTHKLSLMVAPIFAPVKLSSYKCMVSSCLFEVYMYTCTVCVCLRSKVAQKYLHIRVSCLFPYFIHLLLYCVPTVCMCVLLLYCIAVTKTGGKAGKAVLISGKSNVSFPRTNPLHYVYSHTHTQLCSYKYNTYACLSVCRIKTSALVQHQWLHFRS